MTDSYNWVVLAHLLRPQGRKGEILAELFTDFPERFKEQRRVYLAKPGFNGAATETRAAEVTGYWLPVGKNQGRIVLGLAGVDSISVAETVAGLEVLVPREERLELEDGANYISDLIGCTVFDGESPVGVIEDVQFSTSADGLRRLDEVPPMLVLASSDGAEVLVPFAKDFLVAVDAKGKRVEMRLPDGLISVNR